MQGGHAIAHGQTTVARLQRLLSHAQPGRYALRVEGQRGATRLTIG
jgi:hypothetical protein